MAVRHQSPISREGVELRQTWRLLKVLVSSRFQERAGGSTSRASSSSGMVPPSGFSSDSSSRLGAFQAGGAEPSPSQPIREPPLYQLTSAGGSESRD